MKLIKKKKKIKMKHNSDGLWRKEQSKIKNKVTGHGRQD